MSSSSNRFEIFFSVGDIDRSSLYGQRQIMLTAKRISLESGKYISLKKLFSKVFDGFTEYSNCTI